MIDAHQHFWRPSRGDYGWLSPDDPVLFRDFEPHDLAPSLTAAGVDRTVLVQAAPTVEETRFLLGLARDFEFIAGVVGWVDLAADDVSAQLVALSREGTLLGVRPMIQDIANDDWMLDPELRHGFDALVALGLRFDALVQPRHLPRLHRLIERTPDLAVVIDHGAKPSIADRVLQPWADDMARLAAETDAVCKLSGLVTEAGPDWHRDHLQPYVDHLLDTFGPERLLWGSDWPVVERAGGFERWREASLALLKDLTESERDRVLGHNAAAFYGLDQPLAPSQKKRGGERDGAF